jgi:hypothetical protein
LSSVDILCVMTEVRADPDELARLAADTLTASEMLGDGYRDGVADLAVPQSAFGNTVAGPALYSAHEGSLSAADTAVARLVVVQEGDVDRLYRVAFAYQQADAEAAVRNSRPHRGGI